MIECDSCHRHLRATDEKCPFCSRPSRLMMAMNLVGGAVTTVILAACYGPPDGGLDKYPTGTTGTTGDTAAPTEDTGATATAMAAPLEPLLFVEPEDPGTCDLEDPAL